MRKLFIFSVLFLSYLASYAQSGHEINVQLKHFTKGTFYLGNYYGKNTFIVDSAKISDKGMVVFKGADSLPGGIYFILYPKKNKYFELLIDKQQHFRIYADTATHFSNLIFHGSPLNVLFQQYNHYLGRQQKRIVHAGKAGKDSVAMAALRIAIQDSIDHYRTKFINQHPQTLLALLFKAMKDPEVPTAPGNNKDSTFAYHYYRAHYWDGIDFSDDRIVRTPLLETRLQRYFKQLVPPVPDSVTYAADQLLKKAKANKKIFKFILWWLTSTYEKSPYMGMDAVFVHLVEQYYITGKAWWVKESQLKKIINKAARIAPNLIGNTAPVLSLKTPTLKPMKLSNIKADYIILVFWDPTCGHCKIIVPKLDSAYESSWKAMGVKMVGVLAGGTKTQWTNFIQKHHLTDWINLWDPTDQNLYRQPYDVYMTPVIYLLDSHNKIRAKHLNVKQLNNFLNRLNK